MSSEYDDSDSNKAVAIGVALFLGYLLHYLISILAAFGVKGLDAAEQKERAAKMYLFGGACIISMRFACSYSAVFAWFTWLALMFYHYPAFISEPERKKKMQNLGFFVYSTFSTAWWIGEVVHIYANL